MSEVAGKDCVLKISGAAVAFVGEATTMSGTNTKYQITDASKRVLDRTETIHVLVKGSNDTAEAGTNTTNIKMTAHGLNVGDVIINTSRANAKREVLVRVDADNITVAAITSQTTGDTIEVYAQAAAATYSLNRLNGMATFTSAASRTVLISGSYLPMTTAAYAQNSSDSRACDMLEANEFGLTHKKRVAGLLSASGTLSQLNMVDTTYSNALTAGVPIVIEISTSSTAEPNRYWALLESDEIAAAVESLQNETVSWVSYDSWLRLGA
jgi:hypothetical protein